MLKKLLIGVVGLVFAGALGLFFAARAVLGRDTVRTALAGQVSKAIGQPVTIAGIGATIYPRVTVNLDGVAIGEPARIRIGTLHVGTDFRALLSRRIEHASLRLTGARIELPLPPLGGASAAPAPPDAATDAPVELVSIDEIVLNEVELVSGGRTLRGDIEVVPQGNGLVIRRLTLGADAATITATGQITDLSAPAGELSVKAGALDVDQLLAFASAFSSGAGVSAAPGTSTPTAKPARVRPPGSPAMNVTVSLEADRATLGALTIEKLSGRARLTGEGVTLEPMAFALFGGSYQGALALTLGGDAPAFRWTAALSGIDVAAAASFAGSPNTISGRLSGKIDLLGQGADAAAALKTVRGTARLDVTDGVVKNLGLVRTIVTATSSRASASGQGGGSRDEPFSRLGATLTIANGTASTNDLRFESSDLSLAAAGTVRLDGAAVNLAGTVQLSAALTEQAGSDLVRYTQEQGRVTLPATITGSAAAPSVRIDVADMARRALRNRAGEETQKALKKGLGGLLKRP